MTNKMVPLGFIFSALVFLLVIYPGALLAQTTGSIEGLITDPQGNALPQASVSLVVGGRGVGQATTGVDGRFQLPLVAPGQFDVKVEASGFRAVSRSVTVRPGVASEVQIGMEQLSVRKETLTVTADANEGDVLQPDAAMKVFASEDLLDANPGRPGAPISIPGYPIETASSGIKAPQYFAPGVAGDHGEPIAMFIQVGSYLVPNNLSANAHGNGYTDPNIFIAEAIESVHVDGGAFNVREGNHALNLAAVYELRQHLDPFFTLTGDYRDITATTGMSPSQNSWVAMEVSFGNGFLDRLEHRKQVKVNGGEVFRAGDHTLTLFGVGYLGYGRVAGLKPMYGFNSVDAAAGWQIGRDPDTIDPRQKDQTHTALMALNDVWKMDDRQDLQFSGFFRTYNLALFSDFGLGLIRQSEFRTVTGGSVAYVNRITKNFTLLAGMDYEREAPRRDDLDHYDFYNPAAPNYYGPFIPILRANVTIAPVTPYIAGQGQWGRHLRYYVGCRRDEIDMDEQNLLIPANSWSKWVGVNSPKITLELHPGEFRYAPLISASFGKSFFTEDPRAGAEFNGPTSMLPVEQARSYQLVTSKTFHRTDVKLTLGHETQNAEYGKIDSDQGLMFPLGPGRIRYAAATVRQMLPHGSLQATYEQADARLTNTFPTTGLPGNVASIIPEAPRLIGDVSGTYDKLPFDLRTKAEFEYVGRKVVGTGCNESAYLAAGNNVTLQDEALALYCLGVANKEFRLSLDRPFDHGRFDLGLNMMLASGYTGQTTENFGLAGAYAPGAVGVDPVTKLVPGNPVNEVVGVRIPSYASVYVTYRFGR
jgi:hypothetical protein